MVGMEPPEEGAIGDDVLELVAAEGDLVEEPGMRGQAEEYLRQGVLRQRGQRLGFRRRRWRWHLGGSAPAAEEADGGAHRIGELGLTAVDGGLES